MLGRKVFARLTGTLLAVVLWISPFISGGALAGMLTGPGVSSDKQGMPVVRAGELIIKFNAGTLPDKLLQTLKGRYKIRHIAKINNLNVTKIAIDESEAALLAEALKKNPAIRFVQPNHIYRAAYKPGDSMYPQQWGLAAVQAEVAWEMSQGAGIKVAVIDSGIDLSHPDLVANIDRKSDGSINGYNVFHNRSIYQNSSDGYDPDPLPKDLNGHGSHVAGIVAAADNGQGGLGLAPRVKIIPVKVLDKSGVGDDVGIAEGIKWAADNGARVINLSLGGPDLSYVIRDAVTYARSKDVIVVAAAGNEGRGSVSYPAALPGVIGVVATDRNNRLAQFSNYGQGVDVAAPGVGILSTLPTYNVTLNQEGAPNNYGYMDGTSMAAPFVTGLAALILAQNPSMTPEQVEQRIKSTATDLGAGGNDSYFGAGLINAGRATETGTTEKPVPVPGPTPNPTPAPPNEPVLEQKATVTAGTVNVRTGPGTSNSVITVVHAGDIFTVFGAEGGWSKVRLANETTGYIATRLIKIIEQTGEVNVSAANVRTGPGTQFTQIATVFRGEILNILGTINSWFKVRLSSGTTGYIAGWLIKVLDGPAGQNGQKATVKVSAGNVRSGPGTNYSVIATISYGTEVNILGREGTWYKIRLSDGRTGYIYSTLIQTQ